jgi:hypothetical protein
MDLSSGASTRHLHTEAEDASVQHGQAAGSAADHSSSGSSRPEPGSSSSTSPSLSQPGTGADLGLDPSSIFYTTKKPGRLTTPPSIGLDLEPKTELRRRGTRKLAAATPADAVTNLLKAKYLWDLGYSGKGIKVRGHSAALQGLGAIKHHAISASKANAFTLGLVLVLTLAVLWLMRQCSAQESIMMPPWLPHICLWYI